VAVCTDTPKQIARERKKHGLKGTFIADPALVVTDLFGLRNHSTAVRPPGLAGLPVPTSLLVSAEGVVVWKDQSVDYVQRSDPDYISEALRNHF
jgi:peroxiredoxin